MVLPMVSDWQVPVSGVVKFMFWGVLSHVE